MFPVLHKIRAVNAMTTPWVCMYIHLYLQQQMPSKSSKKLLPKKKKKILIITNVFSNFATTSCTC